MTLKKLNLEDFQADKISKNQQKMVQGGDETTGPVEGKDPVRGGGGGGGTT